MSRSVYPETSQVSSRHVEEENPQAGPGLEMQDTMADPHPRAREVLRHKDLLCILWVHFCHLKSSLVLFRKKPRF